MPGFAAAAFATVLGGCASALPPALPPAAFASGTPELRPEVFFAGTTTSTGVLENSSGAPVRRFSVTGSGRILPDGGLRLDQRVAMGRDPPATRTWMLRRLDAHHYTGTLTDAAGEVTAEAYGDLLHLRYAMKSPAIGEMEQWLYLQPDGRTVMNEATVSVMGFPVARLSERITHDGS